jgi:hypothetical protein
MCCTATQLEGSFVGVSCYSRIFLLGCQYSEASNISCICEFDYNDDDDDDDDEDLPHQNRSLQLSTI